MIVEQSMHVELTCDIMYNVALPLSYIYYVLNEASGNLKLTGSTRNIDATHTDTMFKDFEDIPKRQNDNKPV